MKKFKTLVENILQESPVAVNSKATWVSSILHRLSLNRSDASTETVNAFKKKYPADYKDVLTTDTYYFQTFAVALTHNLTQASRRVSIDKKQTLTASFVSENILEILKQASIVTTTTIGNNLESVLQDIFQEQASNNPERPAMFSVQMLTPFIVEAVVDKMFDDVFAEETIDIEDYHASREVEDRQGMSGKYPYANPAETDKEWDDFILHSLKKVLPVLARELRISYSPNKNTLSYTARIIAQATEAVAQTFPTERTGMGRGSGGDKRRGEEIMTASANKREMVAKAVAAVEDSEEFNKYDYIFNSTDTGLDDHEKELLQNVLEVLPVKSSNRYSSNEIVQSCIRNRIFSVPARVRAFIKTLMEKNIVEAVPVIKASTASRSDIDLF